MILINKLLFKNFMISLNIQSIGVSIIDADPKEVVYLAIHKPLIKYGRKIGLNESEVNENFDVVIEHAQLDNMSTFVNPVILSPQKLLDAEESKGEKEEYTPFIQLKLERDIIKYKKSVVTKYPCIMFAAQEIQCHVETEALNNILEVSNKIFSVFFKSADEFLSAKYIKEKSDLKTISLADRDYTDREEISPALVAAVPSILNDEYYKAEKTYFEYINIGAVKLVLTLRFEHKNINLSVKQGFGTFSIGYALLANIASITDSPLRFSELTLTHIYSAPSNVVDLIVKSYSRQGIMQFYKLIGSSDLLGNPVGFVDKLGSGFYELFNEPRKGMLKGPTGFVGGVGKGVGSLLGNFTSATFGSFSKISGSLYNVTKDISFQKIENEEKAKGVTDGLVKGAKGGAMELVSGKIIYFFMF